MTKLGRALHGLLKPPGSAIPGPKGLPIIGNNWQYWPLIGPSSKLRMHEAMARLHRKYGPIVKERVVLGREVVHLFDPDYMVETYLVEGRCPQRLSHRALYKFRMQRIETYGGGGLLPSNGDDWLRIRTPFSKLLLNPELYIGLDPFQEVTDDFIKRISRYPEGEPRDLSTDLFLWALEMIGKIALDTRIGALEDVQTDRALRLVKAASDTHQGVMLTENGLPFYEFFRTPAYRLLESAQLYMEKEVKEYMKPALEKVAQTPDHKSSDEALSPSNGHELGRKGNDLSLLERMLRSPNIDHRDVFTMIMDMFLAGIDTTSFSALYALYNLGSHLEIQEKCRREILQATGGSDHITTEALHRMDYLRKCIKETLRIFPISLGVGRIMPKEVTIGNHVLPQGTIVINHHMVSSLDEKYFPDPHAFRPERYDRGENRRTKTRHHPMASLPFGFGNRMCVGRRISELELQMVLAKLLSRFRVEYVGPQPLALLTRLINIPAHPVLIKLQKLR